LVRLTETTRPVLGDVAVRLAQDEAPRLVLSLNGLVGPKLNDNSC
jgi:hypothetical protein